MLARRNTLVGVEYHHGHAGCCAAAIGLTVKTIIYLIQYPVRPLQNCTLASTFV